MTMQSLLLILLGGALMNNYVLQGLLGLTPSWATPERMPRPRAWAWPSPS